VSSYNEIISRGIAAYEAEHGEIVPSPEAYALLDHVIQLNSMRTKAREERDREERDREERDRASKKEN
jgi:hypothetical protein